MNEVDAFLRDPMFGYPDGLKRPASVEQYTKDYYPLRDIANKIEAIRDPYEAARVAVRLSVADKERQADA